MMQRDLSGEVLLITGTSRGLGRALVEAAAGLGAAKIYAASRNATAFADQPVIKNVQLDLQMPQDACRIAGDCSDTTVLVNNAGYNAFGTVVDEPLDEIDREFQVNVLGPTRLVRAFAALPGGRLRRVVNVISICGMGAMPGLAGYSASKAAMFSFDQAMHPILAERGIRVQAALPGPMNTDMNEGRGRDQFPLPREVAAELLTGILRGDRYVLPDARAREVYASWRRDPLDVAADFRSVR